MSEQPDNAIDDGGTAFPFWNVSLRMYLAGKAMASLIQWEHHDPAGTAIKALAHADALIEASKR